MPTAGRPERRTRPLRPVRRARYGRRRRSVISRTTTSWPGQSARCSRRLPSRQARRRHPARSPPRPTPPPRRSGRPAPPAARAPTSRPRPLAPTPGHHHGCRRQCGCRLRRRSHRRRPPYDVDVTQDDAGNRTMTVATVELRRRRRTQPLPTPGRRRRGGPATPATGESMRPLRTTHPGPRRRIVAPWRSTTVSPLRGREAGRRRGRRRTRRPGAPTATPPRGSARGRLTESIQPAHTMRAKHSAAAIAADHAPLRPAHGAPRPRRRPARTAVRRGRAASVNSYSPRISAPSGRRLRRSEECRARVRSPRPVTVPAPAALRSRALIVQRHARRVRLPSTEPARQRPHCATGRPGRRHDRAGRRRGPRQDHRPGHHGRPGARLRHLRPARRARSSPCCSPSAPSRLLDVYLPDAVGRRASTPGSAHLLDRGRVLRSSAWCCWASARRRPTPTARRRALDGIAAATPARSTSPSTPPRGNPMRPAC